MGQGPVSTSSCRSRTNLLFDPMMIDPMIDHFKFVIPGPDFREREREGFIKLK